MSGPFLPKNYSRYLALGAEIAASIAIPVIGGFYADSYFDSSPWFTLTGSIIGMAGFVITIVRISRKLGSEKRMNNKKDSLFRKTLKASGILMVLAAFFLLIHIQAGLAVLAGVLLSAVFITSSALTLDLFGDRENNVFIKAFFISTALRFALILVLFGILLEVIKINEIYFTVSFIISYLCLSVTEMVFINKILQKSGK